MGENSLPDDMVERTMRRFVILGMVTVMPMIGMLHVHAGEAPAKGELQDMGERFGRFMGSFVQEMGQAAVKQETDPTSRLGSRRATEGRQTWGLSDAGREREGWRSGSLSDGSSDVGNGQRRARYRSSFPAYDPWGAQDWGYRDSPIRSYDPWGSPAGYADWDWEMGRGYYGSGALAPWEHDPRDGGVYGPGRDWRTNRYDGDFNAINPDGGYGKRYDGPSSGWGGRSWGRDGYDPGLGGLQ